VVNDGWRATVSGTSEVRAASISVVASGPAKVVPTSGFSVVTSGPGDAFSFQVAGLAEGDNTFQVTAIARNKAPTKEIVTIIRTLSPAARRPQTAAEDPNADIGE
jgi:hypothetical protein